MSVDLTFDGLAQKKKKKKKRKKKILDKRALKLETITRLLAENSAHNQLSAVTGARASLKIVIARGVSPVAIFSRGIVLDFR